MRTLAQPYVLAICLLASSVADASAQVIGTLRWQFAPFCNIVSLLVEQKGSVYQLTGTDDQCGAPRPAAASGTAHLNADGTATIALTVHRASGHAITSSVVLNVATLSGPWADDYGNNGTFTYNPPGPAAGAPVPVTLRGNFVINYRASAANDRGVADISFGRHVTPTPVATAANYIPAGGAATANCPGSATSPAAAPGHLCVYERIRSNIGSSCITRTGSGYSCGVADPFGASIFTESAAAGYSYAIGSWAMTIP